MARSAVLAALAVVCALATVTSAQSSEDVVGSRGSGSFGAGSLMGWWRDSAAANQEMPVPSPAPLPKPLLGLVMIVKDEASSIADVLDNALPFVDQWFIYDTGSTDGTQEIIRNVTSRFPEKFGILEEGPFGDFSSARNHALDIAAENVEFTLMLDGDWYISDPENKLRAFLQENRHVPAYRTFMIKVNQTGSRLMYPSMRILRTSEHIRYVHAIHEVPDAEQGPLVDERVSLVWTPTATNAEMSFKRWHRDLVILQGEYERNRTARTVFYLAQTYGCLDMHTEAYRHYLERAQMPETWEQERFIAYLQAARHSVHLNMSWMETMDLLLKAHEMVPTRAEAMAAIAQHYFDKGAYVISAQFTALAAAIPMPGIGYTLFIERSVYDDQVPYLASVTYWYVGKYEEGLKYALRVVKKYPTVINKNTLWFYLDKLGRRIPDDVKKAHEIMLQDS